MAYNRAAMVLATVRVKQGFELRDNMFEGVEVRAIRRRGKNFSSAASMVFAHSRYLVR
jgi:hypothetical protein